MIQEFLLLLPPLVLLQQPSNGWASEILHGMMVLLWLRLRLFKSKTGMTAGVVRREEEEEQTECRSSQKKVENKEIARPVHPGESKSGWEASKSLRVQTISIFLVVNTESRRGSLLEGRGAAGVLCRRQGAGGRGWLPGGGVPSRTSWESWGMPGILWGNKKENFKF